MSELNLKLILSSSFLSPIQFCQDIGSEFVGTWKCPHRPFVAQAEIEEDNPELLQDAASRELQRQVLGGQLLVRMTWMGSLAFGPRMFEIVFASEWLGLKNVLIRREVRVPVITHMNWKGLTLTIFRLTQEFLSSLLNNQIMCFQSLL